METINDIQNKFHHIAQFLGGFGHSYVSPKEDDSHTSFHWDIGKSALISKSAQKVHLELSYQDIVLRIHCRKATYELDLLGVSYSIIEDWIRESLEDFGLDPTIYQPNAGYPLKTPFDGFTALNNEEEKAILTAIEHRNIAQKCLQDIGLTGIKTSEIRVWPHDFDTGMLIAKGPNDSFDQVIGCGYAISDDICDTPYYYAYAWSKENHIGYANTQPLTIGSWYLGSRWKGIVLPAGTSDPVSVETVSNFFEETLKALSF